MKTNFYKKILIATLATLLMHSNSHSSGEQNKNATWSWQKILKGSCQGAWKGGKKGLLEGTKGGALTGFGFGAYLGFVDYSKKLDRSRLDSIIDATSLTLAPMMFCTAVGIITGVTLGTTTGAFIGAYKAYKGKNVQNKKTCACACCNHRGK